MDITHSEQRRSFCFHIIQKFHRRDLSCRLLSLLLSYTLLLQFIPHVASFSNADTPNPWGITVANYTDPAARLGHATAAPFRNGFSASARAVVKPETLTDAVVSRHKPTLNGGRIEGSLRVLEGESFAINGSTEIAGDLYLVGKPAIQTGATASYGEIVDDGGAATPANYTITLGNNVNLPGRIHTHADAMNLPADFPASVPASSGTRALTVRAQADVNALSAPADWQTVRDLNIKGSGLTIDLPPGNFGTLTVNGNNQVNFSAGTYNFANTFSLDGGATLQATGLVTINVGQNLTINSGALTPGSYTAPGDVHLNVLGPVLNINSSSQVSGLVRAYNGTVTLGGTAQVRGQVIANSISLNGGKVIGAVWPARSANGITVFGPRRFDRTIDRTTGRPNQYLDQFSIPTGTTSPYTLHIQNGAPDGSNRVSSAIVKLNGINLLTPTDLNQNVNALDRTISLEAGNQLDVSVASVPGSYLIINIAGTAPPNDTTPPLLTITAPLDQSTTTASSISVSGTASDVGEGSAGVAHVYVNDVEATYDAGNGSWSLSNLLLNPGANQISVRAVDHAANQTTSIITVTRAAPENHAPTVDAGPDQTMTLPQAAKLHGTAGDDGQPQGSSLTTTWAMVGGPGTVAFANVAALDTTASFSKPGTYLIRLTASDGALSSSDELSITVEPENQPPTVNAGQNQTISLPSTATLNGAATDDGLPTGSTLSSLWNQLSGPGVTTFEDSAESQTVASFSEPGTYVLQLTASDTELTSRGEVTITVQPQNQPPLVAAGPDQVISLPNSAQLNGLVSDDGWPAGSNLTTAWSVVSGPGAVAFANASVTVTSVVFVVPGTYVLRLAVSDGELSASDDLSITVTPPNQAPTVNAGADQTIELPAAVLLKASFSDDGLPEGSNVSTTWSKASGPGDVLFSNPNSPITSATFCAAGIYVLRLSVTDSLLSNSDEVTVIVRGLQTLTLKSGNGEIGQPDQLNLASRDGGLTYQPAYVVERYDSSVYVPGTNFVWGLIPGSRWINFVPSHWMAGPLNWNAGPSTTKYRATFTFPSDYSQPSLFGRIEADDVATVFLNGTQIVSHSGFADPAGFVFTDDITRFQSGPNVVDITLFDSGGGVGGLDYKFQILSVTATPHANQPPTVNAGTSQIISLPNQASLMGGVRDDTLPCGGTLSVEWVKVSGPGAVVFGSAGSADGSASFSVTGTYVLRLSANDGELTAADEITIEVQPPNQAPLVNAGADQTIRQPEAATLNGSVTDDGRPSGQTLSAQWTKQSGPGNVTFLNVNTSITTASFSAAGTYVLRLTASDSILNASDDVVVTVYPLTTTCTNDDFADDFDDNTLDVTKWVIADPASTVSVREQNQRLEMILRPNTVAYNGVSSVATFDFRGKRFEVGVPQVTSVVGYTETFVTLSRDSGNYYLIDAGGGSLTLDAYTAGLRNRTVIDYNAASHRFWRIRHDSAANAINFETSKDGSAWTTGKTLAASFPLNAMKITLFAGAWGTGNGAPGLAAFDNVRLIPLVPNCLPSVSLSNPVNNSTFGAGANVVIEANASDSDGSVARVEFFSGNAKLGEATANPYRFTWNNVAEGHYSLRTRATDDRGAIADAEPIAITVIANRPPVVSAGQDQVVELPGEASLSGSVTDDGLPAGGGVTSVWSKVSGPGAVVFENVNAPPTTASFGAPGNYVIRLTASDTELVGSDDVTITVNPRNQPPLVSAGTDQVITLHGNLVENPGNEQASTNGAVAGWIAVEGAWTQGSESSGNGSPEPQRGNFYFFANGAQQAELRQDIDLSAYAGTIAAGTQQFEFRAYLRSAAEAAPDVARIIIEYRDTTNNNVIASLDSGAISSTSSWHLTEDTRTAPPGTGWISVRMLATRNSGTTNDAFFDSISLRPIDTVAVKLNGIVTDDGLPGGSSVSVHWTALGGPGPVTFANANTANSGAAFITPGTYVLRLVATDGQLSSNADVTVSVDPPNQPPLVNAGSNQTITLPALAALNGAITDDGFPRGATVALGWRRVAGPGDVAFANANSTTTTAGFSQPGIYILRLTADDGDYATTADVTINVDNPATNQPPVVSAGADQTLSQPADTLTLSGNVADDGLPAAHNLIVQWTQVNGPAAVIFGSLNNSVSIVRFSTPGTYLLRLSANDGELSTSDDVLVSVLAENYPPTIDAGPDQTTLLSQLVPLNGGVSDDGLPLAGSLTTSWTVVSGPDPVTFANANVRVTSAQFSSPGMYVLRLSATDGQLSASDEVNITVRENVAPPAVKITSPADGDSVTQPTAVAGSVSDGVWELEYSLASDDNTNNRIWTSFAGGDGMVSGDRLGTLDPTMMLNGLYDVRLTATDSYGQSSRTTASVIVERNFKVGNFTVSFTDLNVPLAGLPIEVSRTYDSRDKRVGDFGFGWTLGLRNVRLEKSGPLGLRWYETVSQEILPNYCLEATGSHLLTVTFAGGKVFKFQAVVTPRCQRVAPITTGTLTFASLPGTQGTLEVLGSSDFQVEGSIPGPVNLLGLSNGVDVLNSSVFKFTAEDGTAYVIDQRVGLQSISDTNGNTVTVTTGGLIHSGGKSISFTRDSLGRITQITPPAGNAPSYSYDARGDLASYTDAENNTSTYTYDSNHRLLSIRDPRGIEPIRNEYDADGRLVSHTDGFGKVISYDHDLAARVETVTDRLGNPTRFEYDERGNVLRKTDARGGATSFTYDTNDNVLSETNALGRTTTYTYDANDHRTSTTDPLGITTEFTYNPLGKILTATDALGHTTINTYDGAGNLLSTRDALNNTTAFTYSPFDGQRTSLSDALDNVTRYEYSDGYLAKEKDALGNETTFTYDANGNRASQNVRRTNAQEQPEAITTSYEYDKLNRLTKTNYTDGSATLVEYNAFGRQEATIDQLGRRTEFTYDDMGRLVRTSYPDGTHEETAYDAEGRRLSSTDRAGHVTSYTYDELGRLTKTTYVDGSFATATYDAAGQLLAAADARGNVTRYFYDEVGRRTKVSNALNEETTFTYDANGNQLSLTDAAGHTTTHEYDANNRRLRTIYADGTLASVAYDAVGRSVSQTDQAGKTSQFTYDALGRLLKVRDALNQETTYAYDEVGQELTQTDANNHTTRFEYDQLGRRIKRLLPLGQSETYSYDAVGNLTTRTDRNGKVTIFTYDVMRRLLQKAPDPSLNQTAVSFTYNGNGQRVTMNDAAGATVYAYDVRNRLAGKQTPFGALSYTYDEAGNLLTTRSANANGVSVDYSHDALNRLTAVKDNNLPRGPQPGSPAGVVVALNGDVTSYGYDAVGNLEDYVYPNSVSTHYAYNSLNRLITMRVGTPVSALAGYTYTLGPAGNRTAVTELSGRTVTYTYDDLYRLTSETIDNDVHGNNGALNYIYDPVGNRLSRSSTLAAVPSQSSTFDANDRLASDIYDRNGNTLQSNTNSYTYDFDNRLTSFITHNSSLVTFIYDGDGNRVARTVGGVTTNYLVDTNNPTGYAQVVEELQGGVVTRQFTYGHDLISQRCTPPTANCSLVFYGFDGHGSVRLLTDAGGAVTDTYDYDAFGNLISRTGTTANDYLYSGEQFDSSLGFYYLRARYLNPASGRFWTADSFEGTSRDPVSLHKYLYSQANPANRLDPSGNASLAETVESVAISTIVFAGYNTTFHSVLFGVGAVLNLAGFVGSEGYAYETVSITPGGPAAYAEGLVAGAEVTLGVARSITNVFIATEASAQSASEIAASFQGSGRYPGIDRFRNFILRKGTIIFAGEPGVTGFFTTEKTITRAGGDATRLFEGLQVRPQEMSPGIGEYRPGVTAYEVTEDSLAAFGIVGANPGYGKGGFPQIFLPNWELRTKPLVSYSLGNRIKPLP